MFDPNAHTGVRIAQATSLSRATISRILIRLKLNKIRMLEPAEPVVRYEHPAAGDLLHIDIKKLARIVRAGHRITGDPRDETRGAGWEFLYVAVDDHLRLAYTALYPNEKAVSSNLPQTGLLRQFGFTFPDSRLYSNLPKAWIDLNRGQ
jgi:hypothetical protein